MNNSLTMDSSQTSDKTKALEQRIATLEKQLSQAGTQTGKPGQNAPSYDTNSSHPQNYVKQNAGNPYQNQMMMVQAYTMLAAVMTKMYDSMANAYKQVEKTIGAMANYQSQGMQPAYAGMKGQNPAAANYSRGNYQSGKSK